MTPFRLFSFILFSFILGTNTTLLSQDTPKSLEDYFKQEQIKPERINDGVFVEITQQGKGPVAKAGDYVKINFVGSLLNESVFDQSESNTPFVFQLGRRQVIKGWDIGLSKFNAGSKGRLYIQPLYGYGKTKVGNIPANSPLIFDIELLEIMDVAAYDRFMIDLEKKERLAYEKQQKQQFVSDKKIIQEYALKNKIKAKRLDSGLSYSITKKGKGQLPGEGDKVTVHYESYLADGKKFDSSFGKKPYTFEIGKRGALKAWQEGIQYFSKGSEGWLLLPSRLGYGPEPVQGKDWFIPANSVLIYKIKVVSIERSEVTTSK